MKPRIVTVVLLMSAMLDGGCAKNSPIVKVPANHMTQSEAQSASMNTTFMNGAVLANGANYPNGAVLANGTIFNNGTLFPNGTTMSNGSAYPNGTMMSNGNLSPNRMNRSLALTSLASRSLAKKD